MEQKISRLKKTADNEKAEIKYSREGRAICPNCGSEMRWVPNSTINGLHVNKGWQCDNCGETLEDTKR